MAVGSERRKDHYSYADQEALLEELASFEAAIAIKPGYAKAWFGKAITLFELDRLGEALTSFEEAIRLKPDYAEAWYGKAVALRKLKKREPKHSSEGDSSANPPEGAEFTQRQTGRFQELLGPGFKENVSHQNINDTVISRPDEGFKHPPFSIDRLDSNPFNLLEPGESLVVDASNLIRHVGCDPHNGKPCNNPARMWMLCQLLEQEEDWEKTTTEAATCFKIIDASLRHHVDDQAALEKLIRQQTVIQMPPGHPSDHLILQLADETIGVILSNDSKMRKEYAPEYPWLKEEYRFMRYVLVSDKHKKIEFMRRPRPSSWQRVPGIQARSLISDEPRKQTQVLSSNSPRRTQLLKEQQPLQSSRQMEMPAQADERILGLRRRATSILQQLSVLTKRYKSRAGQVPCRSCGAFINASDPRVRFCYRCRAPVVLASTTAQRP